jgi:dephospho-CoA kinase
MLIIGIAGRMRTGKTTLALELRRKIKKVSGGKKVVAIDSFAEQLRVEVSKALWPKLGDSSSRFLLFEKESNDKESIRPLLQALGQAKRDIISVDYWVDALEKNYSNKGAHVLIVDDVRHQNEADWILRSGGILIRLSANEQTLKERGAKEDRLAHYSENAMKQSSDEELAKPHRVLTLDTGGLSPLGMIKALWPFVEEMIGDEQ